MSQLVKRLLDFIAALPGLLILMPLLLLITISYKFIHLKFSKMN